MGEAMRKALVGLLFWVGVLPALAQPVIIADGQLEFCHGESVTLCVVPATYVSYLWNNGSSTSCIIVTEIGDYWPIMLDNNGNIDSSLAATPATVIVHRPEPQVYVMEDTLFVTETFEAYQWYRNGSLLEGATDSFYVVSLFGNHYVEVTDEYGCTGYSVVMEIGPPNGIDDIVSESLMIHPNPASTHLTITIRREVISHVLLFDITGKELGLPPMLSETEKSITLDVSGLPSGIYFGQVLLGESRRSFKWVKE